MAEKVKFTKIVNSGRKYKDKPIINIETSDGRTGSAFDEAFLGLKLNEEYEVDIKEGKEYEGEMQYYFNIPNSGGNKKGFVQKDWTLEKRKISLECSIESIKLIGNNVTSDAIIALADKFFNYLNQK
jgi:non-canonical (house-cleaning) NTP pyrophosphatase